MYYTIVSIDNQNETYIDEITSTISIDCLGLKVGRVLENDWVCPKRQIIDIV